MRIHADGWISLVLILMAGASLVSMLATLTIDGIVHGDLYFYGLQFSTQWAVPYWTMAAVVFSMGWLIIVTSIAFELYLVIHRLRRSSEPDLQITRQEPVRNEVSGILGDVRVIARNNGTAPLTISEVWIRDVKQTSVSPALPCIIQSHDETMFVVSTGVSSDCSYQVKLVSARGNSFILTGTARPRQIPRMEAEPTRESEKKQMMNDRWTSPAEKEEDDLSEFRALPEERSVITSLKVVGQKAEDKPISEH